MRWAVDVLPADLTSPADLSALETRLRDDNRIGILINNAGMAQAGGFLDQTVEGIDTLITLNTTALTRLAAAVAPRFAQSATGAIVNIGSVVGFAPEFGMSIYGATKAFVEQFTRNLRADPRASLLMVDPYAPAEGAPRLSLMGHAEPVTLDTLAQARFVRLHPAAEQYLSFGDFSFWQLRPERLRLIGGFGAAGWVTGSRYCHAPALSLADEANLLAELGDRKSVV